MEGGSTILMHCVRLVIMTLKHYNVCALHYDFSTFSAFALHCIRPKISNDIKCFLKFQMTLSSNDIKCLLIKNFQLFNFFINTKYIFLFFYFEKNQRPSQAEFFVFYLVSLTELSYLYHSFVRKKTEKKNNNRFIV